MLPLIVEKGLQWLRETEEARKNTIGLPLADYPDWSALRDDEVPTCHTEGCSH